MCRATAAQWTLRLRWTALLSSSSISVCLGSLPRIGGTASQTARGLPWLAPRPTRPRVSSRRPPSDKARQASSRTVKRPRIPHSGPRRTPASAAASLPRARRSRTDSSLTRLMGRILPQTILRLQGTRRRDQTREESCSVSLISMASRYIAYPKSFFSTTHTRTTRRSRHRTRQSTKKPLLIETD